MRRGPGKEDDMDHQIRRIDRQLAVEGSVLRFYRDTMSLPDGRTEIWDYVEHKRNGACVVPVLPDGRILMIRQYRPILEREILELPAGVRDSENEDTRITAARELREETGCVSEDIRFLTRLKTAVAWCSETTDVYVALNAHREGDQELDPAEEIGVEVWSLPDLLEQIYSGEIEDAKTVAGLGAYAARYGAAR